MGVSAMNHFTILTHDLEATLAFYAEHLNLRPGARPPFSFRGAWLYAKDGTHPILHIIADKPKDCLVPGVIDHMAFTGQNLKQVKARFDERGLKYDLRRQAGAGTWQLFSLDPNGAKVELDFDPSESL